MGRLVRRKQPPDSTVKFALVNGQRQEAQSGLSGTCPACGKPMVAKCGEVRIHHWAHKGERDCDPWWENETEWHRAWKDDFPTDWQEIVHAAGDGERHVADVKTDAGWVIEFQHSYLKPEERRSRDAFYPKLIWVVDGTRRKRDQTQVMNAWIEGVPLTGNPSVRKVFSADCRLLQEWAGSSAPTFLDLGVGLWWVFARSTDGSAYIQPVSRASFVALHRGTAALSVRQFEELMNQVPKLIAEYESRSRAQPLRVQPLQPRRFRKRRF